METMIVTNKNGDVIINVDEFDPNLFSLKPGEPVPDSVAAKFDLKPAEPTPTPAVLKTEPTPEVFDRAAVETYLTMMGVVFEADATDKKLVELKTELEAKIAAGKQGE